MNPILQNKPLTLAHLEQVFDDIVDDGERDNPNCPTEVMDAYWIYVCEKHAKQYGKLGGLDESPIEAICGVAGCCGTSDYYLDILLPRSVH